ncbi:MAG: hypothetical protein KGY42_04370, partial [Desulfobacterales bacterium]|nr:hypothetical protein [Desulfobacterales bacterium]
MYRVLNHATLIDGNGNRINDSVLVFNDDRIEAAGPGKDVRIPESARHYDLSGKYILPGLIDAHIHMDLHGMPDTIHESMVEDKLRA